MPYIIKNKAKDLYVIDYSARYGLHYQLFRNKQASRNTNIVPSATNQYTATLDHKNHLHIICKNSRNQVIHLSHAFSGFDKEILLDDSSNTYGICNLYVTSLRDKLHLFYYANSPVKQTAELVHHIISSKEIIPPQSLGTIPNIETSYDCIVDDENLYILLTHFENNQYSLVLRTYDALENRWETYNVIDSSQFPITHTKMVVDKNGILHIIYVEERYGKFQIYYKKKEKNWREGTLIHAGANPMQPTLFIYHDALWVNWVEQGTLKMMLSTDLGESFSSPVSNSTLGSKIALYHYIYPFSEEKENLICNALYGSESPTPRFAVLSQLDMDHIHPDLSCNEELKLYVNHLMQKHVASFTSTRNKASELEEKYRQLQEENMTLKQIQENIVQQYENTANLASQIQAEGKKWRTKYAEAEQKVKIYEKQIQKLKADIEQIRYTPPRHEVEYTAPDDENEIEDWTEE